jgi:hypothetical protein
MSWAGPGYSSKIGQVQQELSVLFHILNFRIFILSLITSF